MTSGNRLSIGVSMLALAAIGTLCTSASARPVYRPYTFGVVPPDPNTPTVRLGTVERPYVAPKKSKSGKWTDVGNLPAFAQYGPWQPQLLTDGTVLVLAAGTQQWYKLSPDKKGQYTDGTWNAIAPMPAGDCPLYFASQILTDGRLIINGGEYNVCGSGESTAGSLYDPVKDSWTSVTPPSGWTNIGDADSIILPNGTYMLAECCNANEALASISGTTVNWKAQSGYGSNSEEGWTALPGGNVLTVDVWNIGSNYDDYEIYDPTTGTWSLAGTTPDLLTNGSKELGPAPLTPLYGKQGTIIQFSGNPTTGINDIYDVASGTWKSGPVMEINSSIYDCADGPAATLPGGNVLVQASPGVYAAPSHFWEFSISKKGKVTATQVNDTKEAPNDPSYYGNLLLLPTGQVLWDDSQDPKLEVSVYTAKGKPKAAWLPVVSSVSAKLKHGSKGNAISGTNFNGWDLGGTYGDDAQSATNFPIVRITNNSTGDVCFGRSYDFSTMGVWTTGTTNAEFDLPKTCETGASTLQVVVNGIASAGTSVTVS
ncbi:MAG TPA: hypothetical protein VHU23_01790 [Rhizomicrobium sp.]|jgi:hypothetical protein|nr:hypothetical protein [Rhizomicrobium sp.]